MLQVNNLTGFGVGIVDNGFSELFKIKAVDYMALRRAGRPATQHSNASNYYAISAYGTANNNILVGGAERDALYAHLSRGNNILIGGGNGDSLNANRTKGNNILDGGAGDDSVYAMGSTGNNILDGGAGNDYLYADGSTGNNIFIFKVQTNISTSINGWYGVPSNTYRASNNKNGGSDTLELRCTKTQFEIPKIKADILAIKKWVEENPNSPTKKMFNRLNLQIQNMDKITFRYIDE